jgi:ERCC4-type nuclease
MGISIKIDNREKDLILECENRNIDIIKQNLDISDIHIINQHENHEDILVIIERKTYDDLSTSIKDGRYKEQKNRMIHSISSNVRKIYLFEGNTREFKLKSSVLEGTIINTIIRDNIHIYVSKNLDHTIKFILNIVKNIDKYKDSIINNHHEINTNESLIHVTKKKNMNGDSCFINMMSGIPGISNKTAEIFLEKYKSIQKMLFYFQFELENKKDLIIQDLENIKIGSNQRKLGSKYAEKIYCFIYNIK